MKTIAKGAEATLYIEGKVLIKYRKRKGYRIKEIDGPLRYRRTQAEFKALKRCAEWGVPVPTTIKIAGRGDKLYMNFVEGKQIDYAFSPTIMIRVGEAVAKMHSAGVIHGDLTTANMLVDSGKVTLIDFGLSYFSRKDEDRATDIAMFKSALRSRHPGRYEAAYKLFIGSYHKRIGKEFKGIETHLKDIERRRRYHENG